MPSTRLDWITPPPFDGTPRSLAAHVAALGALERGEASVWLGPPSLDPPATIRADLTEPVLVVPTSGSTGQPRAVLLTRSALMASQDATAEVLGGHGAWLPLLPPTHIAGVQVIARAWHTALRGDCEEPPAAVDTPWTLPVLPDLSTHFDADAFVAAAEPFLASVPDGVPRLTSLVPTQLQRLVTGATGTAARARSLLTRFDAVLVGGAATAPDLLARARAARVRVRTTYGSSETAGGCVYDGRALPGVRLRIEDPDHDGSGRLLIASPTLLTGHLGPEGVIDRSALVDDPGGPWLRTSDLANLSAGHEPTLRVLGRADDVITTGGRKVQPQDVERAIERSLMLRGMVTGSVVVGVPDAEWGERVEALVTLAPGVDPAEASALVRAALRTTEVPSHRIPRRVHVVQELPLLGIGKIDRSAARRLAQRADDPAQGED
ncbi:AMP-binding protein [Brachybacterium sp. EF45031]|uniref:AMP-binding protein n=1 Tax=Brachybacterium sillae TaxID=2810536 RepID=UPI00217D2040|nr:AMP-binding protein [Brachybacterium sillae]MCS6711305.1 AMP-binding protein [Brachybacterium sillae]